MNYKYSGGSIMSGCVQKYIRCIYTDTVIGPIAQSVRANDSFTGDIE